MADTASGDAGSSPEVAIEELQSPEDPTLEGTGEDATTTAVEGADNEDTPLVIEPEASGTSEKPSDTPVQETDNGMS